MSSTKLIKKLKSTLAVTSVSSLIFGGICYYRNDEKFFDNVAMPLTRMLFDAEAAHKFAIFACKWNLIPSNNYKDPKTLVRAER